MCGYEGGYSPDYTSLGKSTLDQFRAASKQAPLAEWFHDDEPSELRELV